MDYSKIPHVNVLKITYLPQTNYKPARFKIYSENRRESVDISWDSDNGKDTCEQAQTWLNKNGFTVVSWALCEKFYYIMTAETKELPKPRK
jgi:hypothetical protein